MLGFIFGVLAVIAWLSYEIWKAPIFDDDMNVIQPEKKFKDLFKNKK